MKHLFIPDTQVKPGIPIEHFYWIGMYAMDKLSNSDRLIHAGDHYDFPSLSSYDKAGSKATEGRRVRDDIAAGNVALEILADMWSRRGFCPDMHFTTGNHENRLNRAIEDAPRMLDGILSWDLLHLGLYGWNVHPFLEPVILDGICYSHFHPQNAKGAITQTRNGAPSARAQVQRVGMSATAGHQQGLDIDIIPTGNGLRRGLIAGSAYLHSEDYMPINNYWRGLILKHAVLDGEYGLCEVDMTFLERKYRRLMPPNARRVA